MRRLVVVVNPRAGRRRGASIADRFLSHLTGFEADVRTTEHPGHAREIAATTSLAAVDTICAVGGDGTIHEIVNGMLTRADGARRPLCAVPAGSGNALALDLGYSTPEEAAKRLTRGDLRNLDAARVDLDGRIVYSINLLAWGASARINAIAERLRPFGGTRYTLAAILELLRWRLGGEDAKLDGVRRADVLLGAACITRHSGRGMQLTPDAELDDGLLDLLTIERGGRLELAGVLRSVFDGQHLGSRLVRIERREGLVLELDRGARLVVDGELMDGKVVRVDVVKGAVEVVG
ncbi:MAG: hypothetical protein GY711_11650 [bacterium]|nr:hypothetical protein [bacterium]